MPLSIGDRLGPFEIVAPLGSGGMGEVWRARDTRLDRIVAIKTSRTEFSERFASEARAVAALNHPNICQLYDLGTLPDGGGYLVMEYIDGLPVAPVDSPRKLLDLAVQMADGLAAAHAAGFAHRDLKPDNVLVTGPQSPHPGRVRILDFGLAKQTSSTATSDTALTAMGLTDPGTVLGTVSYMSPEQARGEPVDARSDQFSFGLIVYELAARRRAFARASAAETMTAIIREDAEPLPSSVPAPLRWVVERCLAKDPAERYDSTRDLYRELKLARDRLSEASGAQAAAAPVSRGSRGRTWGVAALGALAIAADRVWCDPVPEPRAGPTSWTGVMLGGPEMALDPRLSPDGHLLAFQAMVDGLTQLAVMTPESGNWSVLTSARDHGPILNIAWSPDGTRIYYDRYTDVASGDLQRARPGWRRAPGAGACARPGAAAGRQPARRQAECRREASAVSLLGRDRAPAGTAAAHRAWCLVGQDRALPDGTAAVVRGEPLGQAASPPGYYLIDLATGATRRVDSQQVDLAAEGSFAVSADGTSLIAAAHAGAVWTIVRVPLNGGGAPTPLLTATSPVWYLDAGPDDTLYASLVDRPTDVVRFAPDGTGTERLASFPQIPDFSTMAVLPDGRAVVPVRASSRVRLMVVQQGKAPTPLVNTTRETTAPVAACGPQDVALMIGPEPHATIAFADPASGRLVRTITPGKGPVGSVSCSPDGQTVYFSASGVVWSAPASGLPADGEPRRIRAGTSVVADPSGHRLIVQALEGSQLHRFSVPLDGAPEREIPTDSSVSVL